MAAKKKPKLTIWIQYHGMTLEEFAKKVGCSVQTIYALQSGHLKPGASLALKIEQLTDGMYPMQHWFEESTNA